ncbi:hypothetical protein Lsan_0348 [Legionella santicrucis]|uniref:Uncharacterized protein n=1 Tax=Legionella santicrucis TaxID=45074 RepID=A0A0W0ZEG0_9GAMM|nr:hypothetical protein [Legionella santicrucis]KTD67553.1 hypothetical protein Lsan_0348 [Legionella santicrucis]
MFKKLKFKTIKASLTMKSEIKIFCKELSAEEVVEILHLLKRNKNVESFTLIGSPINNEGASALIEVLRTNKTLTHLTLSRTFTDGFLDHKKFLEIAEALGKNQTLTKLDLSFNNLGGKAVLAIFNALKKHCNYVLRDLNLQGVELYEWQYVEIHPHLFYPTFEGVFLDQKGEEEMLMAFANNSSLLNLNLASNNLTSDRLKKILDAFQYNRTLLSLHLGFDFINDNLVSSISSLLCANEHLRVLDLSTTTVHCISVTSLKLIVESLEKNTTILKISMPRIEYWRHEKSLVDSLDEYFMRLLERNHNFFNRLQSAEREKIPSDEINIANSQLILRSLDSENYSPALPEERVHGFFSNKKTNNLNELDYTPKPQI